MPELGDKKPNRVKSTIPYELIRFLMLGWFRLAGWKTKGEMPSEPKFVAIGVPHTSNRDFFLMLAITLDWRIKLHWLGKNSIFRAPFGGLLRRLGGIPVDRNSSGGVVEQIVRKFNEQDELALALSPEGTRADVQSWKTGFYNIACQAKVPIVLGFIDNEKKVIGIEKIVYPTGDYAGDMVAVHEFYDSIKGKYPKQDRAK